jgi:hypothetical protein
MATNVRPKSSPEEWLNIKNKNISMFKKMTEIEKQKQQKSLCELGKQITGVFTGKIKPPKMGDFEKMSAAVVGPH